MFWLSSENEVYVPCMYEHGYSANALTAMNNMLSFNPWKGAYRDQMLYGALLPVLQTAGTASCQLIKTGTITATSLPYTINNNPEASLVSVPTNNPTSENGALAYQCINDYFRGGS